MLLYCVPALLDTRVALMSHDTSWYGLYPQDFLLEGISTQLLLTHLIYSRCNKC